MNTTELKIWTLITIITFASSIMCSPPRLNQTEEILVDVSNENLSANLIIRCEAQQNVTWNWTAPLDEQTIEDYLVITYSYHQDTDYPYVSVLKLIDPYNTDTGYYGCQHQNAMGLDDLQNTAKTYAYVYDGENGLAVPRHVHYINVDTSERLEMQCPTTKNDIKVRLIYNEQDISSNVFVSWNSRVGFVRRNLAISHSGFYKCEPDGFDDSVSFYVTVQPSSAGVDPPTISPLPSSHFVVNFPFTLDCMKTNSDNGIKLTWNFPRMNEKDTFIITNKNKTQNEQEYLVSSLTIKSATIKDQGDYECTASVEGSEANSDPYTVIVKETLEPYINLTKRDRIDVKEGDDVDWRTDVFAFPSNPQVIYRYYDRREINDEDERITIEHHTNQAESWLRIKNVTKDDYGGYVLEVISNDGALRKETKTLIQVSSKPYTSLTVPRVVANEKNLTVECIAKGYPIEDVNTTWQIDYCSEGLHTCTGHFMKFDLAGANSSWPPDEGNVKRDFISFMPESSGRIKCKSQNNIGETSTIKTIRISDIGDDYIFRYTVEGESYTSAETKKDLKVIENDKFHLLCGGIKFDFKAVKLEFSTESEGSNIIKANETIYSIIREVSSEAIEKKYAGTYTCSAVPHDKSLTRIVRKLIVNVIDEVAPYFWGDPNMKGHNTISMDEGKKMILNCSVRGTPRPKIDWSKNGQPFTVDKNNEEIHMSRNNQTVEFKFLKELHSGTYKCHIKNRKSHIVGQMKLQVYKNQALSKGAVIGLVVAVIIIIAMIVLVIWLFLRVKKEKDFKNEFRKNELYLFEKGNVGDLNQDCLADEQAQLLPYDKQWEIPRDDIDMGKQLGEGAFGRVVKAKVQNLNGEIEAKTAAVKMCKCQADPSQVRSLAGELKIMIHLGKHLNIVNLIGASTVNISKGELWILVEYCHFGNLLKFMLQHRHHFINQVDPDTDRIDHNNFTLSPLSAGIVQRTSSMRSAIHPLKTATDQDGYLAPSFHSQVSVNSSHYPFNNNTHPIILDPPPKKRLTPIHSPTTISQFSYPTHSPPVSPTSPDCIQCTSPMISHSNHNTPTSPGNHPFLHNNNLPPSSPHTPLTPSEHSMFPMPPTPTSPTSNTSFESLNSRKYVGNPSYSYNPNGSVPEGVIQNSRDSHLLKRNSSENVNTHCNGKTRQRLPSGYSQEAMFSGETTSSCNSNYKNIPGLDTPFTTTTLLLWAWQVAQGMEYLAKRKVLHGDLAARNLLLSENNVVKISDFGLSRDIYKKDVYMKKGDDLMPIKWMSIEAIRDRIFSVQSDVWAYGVTLWEIFTLGSTPYPGVEVNKDFLKLIEDGYRMEQPKLANKEMYRIILDCWNSDPKSRPSYQDISESIGNLLPDELIKNFINMNDINIQLNKERFETQTDYLEMMASPDIDNIMKIEKVEGDMPDYANISQIVDNTDESYLSMQTATGYSKVGLNPDYANANSVTMMHQLSNEHTLNHPNYLPMTPQRASHSPNTDIFSPRPDQDVFNPSHFTYRERTRTVSSQPSILEESLEELDVGNPDEIYNGNMGNGDNGNMEHHLLLKRQMSNQNGGRRRLYSNEENGDVITYEDENEECKRLNYVHSLRDSNSCITMNTSVGEVGYMNLPSTEESVLML
ncbi:unnamed protein product, partial [Meganyctiphanes norvegica]